MSGFSDQCINHDCQACDGGTRGIRTLTTMVKSHVCYRNTLVPLEARDGNAPSSLHYQCSVLLLNYPAKLERVWGLEPQSLGWKPKALPLDDTRKGWLTRYVHFPFHAITLSPLSAVLAIPNIWWSREDLNPQGTMPCCGVTARRIFHSATTPEEPACLPRF